MRNVKDWNGEYFSEMTDDHEPASVDQIRETFAPRVSHGMVTVYTSADGWLYDVGSVGNVFGISAER